MNDTRTEKQAVYTLTTRDDSGETEYDLDAMTDAKARAAAVEIARAEVNPDGGYGNDDCDIDVRWWLRRDGVEIDGGYGNDDCDIDVRWWLRRDGVEIDAGTETVEIRQ